MDVQQLLSQARDTLTVKRVFGEPYEKDGLTVIPVAKLAGGGGGGGGRAPGDQGEGEGGGFGVQVRPAGVFLIRGDDVAWRPAVDVNRIVVGGQVLVAIALLAIRSIVKSRSRQS